MTRDYAKKRQHHRTSRSHGPYARSSASPLIPKWVWLVASLAFGLICIFVLFLKWSSLNLPLANSSIEKPVKSHSAKKAKRLVEQDSPPSRFDFYTVLPAMTMDIPETEAEAPPSQPIKLDPPPKTASSPASDHLAYVIQVGSFRQLAQAEELKAKLTLSGHEVSVQTVKIKNKEIRYRVYMGPFASKEIALLKQQQIERAQPLHSLVLKIPV